MRKLLAVLAAFLSFPALADELTTVDHYVKVISKVPAIEGQSTQIYVREVVAPESVLRGDPLEHRVVLFIHGAGTPAEVAFDPPAEGYSWMKHLARAGFDAFSMDMTGYGRSTRPTPMNDPCNLPERQRREMGLEECEPSYPNRLTTIESDWHDIDTVVDHLRELRAVDKVALIGWSLGGPRAGGYAARHEDKVSSLVLLAPAYFASRDARPEDVPGAGPVFNKQSRSDFDVGWERQVGCEGQYRTEVADAVWQGMMESDPVGATWEAGVRRRPFVTWWGF